MKTREITHFCATGQFRIVQNTSKTPQKSVLRWFWGSTGHFIFCRMRPSLGARGYQSIEGMAQLPTYRGIRYHRKVALPVAGRRFAAAPLSGERLCGPSGSPCNRQPTCISTPIWAMSHANQTRKSATKWPWEYRWRSRHLTNREVKGQVSKKCRFSTHLRPLQKLVSQSKVTPPQL